MWIACQGGELISTKTVQVIQLEDIEYEEVPTLPEGFVIPPYRARALVAYLEGVDAPCVITYSNPDKALDKLIAVLSAEENCIRFTD